jgi:UDP-2-acetamido-3-amino-2,3-dideoxy-glucuronate N-acetyltransferase
MESGMHSRGVAGAMREEAPMIHSTADVSPQATIGAGTRIWHHAQVRENAWIGTHCIIGKGVYIDFGVEVGHNVKIQNASSIYHGAKLEDDVFVGPYVCVTNDKLPRSISVDGALKTDADWQVGHTLVKKGASLGAGAIILPNIVIGSYALVGAGAVVTRSVLDHAIVVGNPARFLGYACVCGRRLVERRRRGRSSIMRCPDCASEFHLEVPRDRDL